MATRTLIPVEEYLTTVYRPDCDYVDGEVLERNLGEREHGFIQVAMGSYFFARRKAWKIEVYPEQRVQVRPNRFRIPDLCVVLGGTKEKIFTVPPFLCVEILSPEDHMSRMQDRIDDYFQMGVPNVWIVDPARRCAYYAMANGDLHRAPDVLRTSDPALEVPLAEIFE